MEPLVAMEEGQGLKLCKVNTKDHLTTSADVAQWALLCMMWSNMPLPQNILSLG